jgi:uncharacterized protein (TIGR03067 family)
MIRGNTFTFLKESKVGTSEGGTFKLDPTRKPKAIDATAARGPDKGKTFLGIYEIGGDYHKVCFAPRGQDRSTAFASKAGSGRLFQVWKREKP